MCFWPLKFLYVCQYLSDQLRLGDAHHQCSAKPHKKLFSCNSSGVFIFRVVKLIQYQILGPQSSGFASWLDEGTLVTMTDFSLDLISNHQTKQKAEVYAGGKETNHD